MSSNHQANWFIFTRYVRILQTGKLANSSSLNLFDNAMSLLAGWFAIAAFVMIDLWYWYHSIWLSFGSLLLMLASSRFYLQLTLKKNKGGKRPRSSSRNGLTGFGRTGTQWITIIVLAAVLLTATSLTGGLAWLSGQFASRGTISTANVVLPSGFAYCPGAAPGTGPAGSYSFGSQPSNCLPIGMNLQVHLQNLVTSASLSGWTCQILWNGGGVVGGVSPGPTGQIAETVANTGSNGNCVTSANLYYPSWSLQVRLCHQTTACSSSSYGAQEYVAVLPFPGGTVPFYYGTQAPTTTYTQPVNILVTPMAGDIAASNTPISMSLQVQNGTAVTTATTCFQNQAKGTNPCYLGAGVYQSQWNVILTNTYTTATYPYVAGYQTDFSDPALFIPQLGTLSTNLQMEVKQTAGTDPICSISGGTGGLGAATTFSNGPYIKSASVPDVIYATGSLSTALTVNRQSGYQVTSSGQVAFSFIASCNGMTTSGDKTSLTFNLYAYYSIGWVSTNGGTLNVQTAVTQMTQFVVTIQTP